MSEEPKRRLADRLGMSPTVISESTTVVGDIETRGPLMVSGHVQGNGKIGGTLSVGKSAHWEGDISARQAVLAGKVTGKIVVEDKLEISASAVIYGRDRREDPRHRQWRADRRRSDRDQRQADPEVRRETRRLN